ncbi:MAG: homoserine kinase [Nocardioides sp.]|nr:homoserine kinase [Nocardioides sp.]
MATFVEGRVRVSVPATSANLGPGFDAFAVALDLRDELSAQVLPGGLEIEVTGAGADDVPRDESHLVVRAMRAAFELMDAEPPGLLLECRNVIPHSRGLGSSSAAIVAGVALARALVAGGQLLASDEALFELACDIEGHPDNVAAAFYGGFVISGREDDRWFAGRVGVDPRISAVVFVPPNGVETLGARALLPELVPHADAAANSGRAALLVVALTGQPEHLFAATRDWLHQDQREPAMPETLALLRRLRAAGLPAVVSGAGPTVLAFGTHDSTDLRRHCPQGWACHDLAIEPSGVRLLA